MVETTILRRTSAERYCARVYTNAMTPRIMIQIYMVEGLPPGRNSMARMEMKTRGVVSKRLRRRKCKERTEVAEKRTSRREEQRDGQRHHKQPAEVDFTGRVIGEEVGMTHPTDPVWIVLNVPIKTGSVYIGGRPPTSARNEKVSAFFETDATLHWSYMTGGV
jgi:hypothetical protein